MSGKYFGVGGKSRAYWWESKKKIGGVGVVKGVLCVPPPGRASGPPPDLASRTPPGLRPGGCRWRVSPRPTFRADNNICGGRRIQSPEMGSVPVRHRIMAARGGWHGRDSGLRRVLCRVRPQPCVNHFPERLVGNNHCNHGSIPFSPPVHSGRHVAT